MNTDNIMKEIKKDSSHLDKLLFRTPSVFHFIVITMFFLYIFIISTVLIDFITGGGQNIIISVCMIISSAIYAAGNFATAQLTGIILIRKWEIYDNLGRNWTDNCIFFPFSAVVFLSLISLFFPLEGIHFIYKTFILFQIYIWIIYYKLRKISKDFNRIKDSYISQLS